MYLPSYMQACNLVTLTLPSKSSNILFCPHWWCLLFLESLHLRQTQYFCSEGYHFSDFPKLRKKIGDMVVYIKVLYQFSNQIVELWVHNMRHYPFLQISLINDIGPRELTILRICRRILNSRFC